MELVNDRQIQISVGTSRKDMRWKGQKCKVSDLYERLRTPIRGTETLEQYLQLKKAQQDDLKDVGGFVAGTLAGERRKASAVIGRDVVTLDFDTIPAYGTDAVVQGVDALGCSYCIYSTRKHMTTAPRLRILIPLDRMVTADEYEPIARRIAAQIGIQMADPTTFEASRLMYFPSVSSDGEYVFLTKDAPFMAADSVLATYADWRDFSAWPQVPGTMSYQKLAVKQGDPEEKPGVVGAFNRTYDIFSAMEKFLPGIYAPVDNDQNRFTYLGGSTTGGAVIYDHGKFMYSHHATDPCGGRLVNAFDMIRLHKFGDEDDEAKADTPSNRLPSFKSMCEFACRDPKVAAEYDSERLKSAAQDFAGITQDESCEWRQDIARNSDGKPLSTIDNCILIMRKDPLLRAKFALNEFSGRGEVLGELPWESSGKRRMWSDTDSNGLYWYMEKAYSITRRGNIDAALDLHAAKSRFNDVQNYLNGLTWDGVQRLDRLFVDYLGAEDCSYTRAVTRKAFAAAVARAMAPGTKFDCMTILCGPQGIGKSTLIDRMSKGWYNDSIRTFEGKDASELLQGVWLVEVAELDAFRRTDVARIKQFLSLRADRYRAAYGRTVRDFPRRCVFFGTCNQMDFLQDTTGNRRFWPVDVGLQPHPKTVWRDLTDATVDQLWAEAKTRWQVGEALFLSGDLEAEAQEKQEAHREAAAQEGVIAEFVERKVPADWQAWPLDRRRDFWATQASGGSYELVDRDRITALEVWCELYNGAIRDIKKSDSRDINAVLANLPGWKRSDKPFRAGPYSVQRGFVRDNGRALVL